MNDIPTSAGSAFWAARGVRIEPEPVDEEPGYEGDAGEGGAEDGEGHDGFESETEPVAVAASVAVLVADGDVAAVAAEPGVGSSDAAPAAMPATASVPAQASAPDAEPVSVPDAELAPGLDAEPVPAPDPESMPTSEPEPEPEAVADPAAEPVSILASPAPEAVAAETTPPDVADAPEVAAPTDLTAAADATPDTDVVPEPAAVLPAEPAAAPAADPTPDPSASEHSSASAPFIPTQASFDEVEPQLGEPVDGLVALNETLIDAARTKAELAAKAAEPVWQLTDDGLAALPDLRTCLEAILLVVDEPVTEVVLAQIVERPTEQVTAALRALSAEYTSQGRGFDLREVGVGDGSLVTQTGWRFYTRAECAPVVERFIRDGQQSRLTQAALETLAVVAYRQPVSRSKVSAIRGVNCDGVMRTLLARGLVEECGTEYETGALLYRTTGYFLERMGLKGLEELPDLAPLLPSAAEMEDEV